MGYVFQKIHNIRALGNLTNIFKKYNFIIFRLGIKLYKK